MGSRRRWRVVCSSVCSALALVAAGCGGGAEPEVAAPSLPAALGNELAARADAVADALPPSDVAVANIDRASVAALAPGLECRRLVASGYFESEDPPLAGFRHLERRRAERWAADLYERE